jgi:Family of unknown function (DUF5681)
VRKHTDQIPAEKPTTAKRLPATAWKPGQSGNPHGRPISARARVSEKLIADIADVWEVYGQNVLRRLAAQEPGTLAKIAYGLLPRDLFISVHQPRPGNLDPEQWEILRNVVDLIQANTAEGAELGATLELIESALRADKAKVIAG